MVNFKLSGKLEYLFDCENRPAGGLQYSAPTRESFADRRLRGDTIAELMHYAGGCERVFAFEPDAKTYPQAAGGGGADGTLPTELPVCSARHIPTGRCWSLTAARAGSRRCGSLRW